MDDRLGETNNQDDSLFPGTFTIRALRDSRYHNTAYAIAELIDNSIEADASKIELLCMEELQFITERTSRRAVEIAVIDNGKGMDFTTLFNALKFGGGTRHLSPRGIGKYGMGLPTSSMSQCKRVDVWTWQEGMSSSIHTHIDADEIQRGNYQVNVPDRTPIPDSWIRASNPSISGSKSGTLVVWTKLDRVKWRPATIVEHTSREIGRIHRHWISNNLVEISTGSFVRHAPSDIAKRRFLPNDPLYLMAPSSTPSPWDSRPMFVPYGETEYIPIKIDDKEETVTIKYSIVNGEALDTPDNRRLPGGLPHGRHARHNIGVSVVREGREILLEDAFLREGGSADNPMNRWWGCEVQFGRGLDEMFGLDHNKQMAAFFTQAARDLAGDDRPRQRILDELEMDQDTIYMIVEKIRRNTGAMMEAIRQEFKSTAVETGHIEAQFPRANSN